MTVTGRELLLIGYFEGLDAATHIDVCLGRRRRLPIAIGDTVVRRIIGVDPVSARLQDGPEAVRVCR